MSKLSISSTLSRRAALPRPLLLCGLLVGLLALALPAAPAGATPVAIPVGPHQAFVGLVNDTHTNATIQVLCPGGPLFVGEKGHPVAGQTVGVATPSAAATAAPLGYTGTAAHAIGALFGPAATSAAVGAVVFTTYGDKPLPTTLTLPCYGTGTVSFVPRPTSATARPFRVSVTYIATCGSLVCPVVTTHARRH